MSIFERAKLILAGVLLAGLMSCSHAPSDNEVRAEFLREHPTYTVEFVGVGEGDGSAAYFHIRYKKPSDDRVYEEVWQHLNTGDKLWKLNHKETLSKPYGY